MKKALSILRVLLVITTLIFVVGCTKTTGVLTRNKAQVSMNNSGTNQRDGLTKYSDIGLSVQDELNFDVWWKGPYSHYAGLQGKKLKIKVYGDNSAVLVYLDKHLSNPSYSGYYALLFSPNSNGGYDSVGSIPFSSQKDVAEYINNCEYYGEKEIQIGEISQPSFGPITEKKNNLIILIEKKLPLSLKNEWDFKRGNYKVYIKDFKDSSSYTYVIIENLDGKQWFGEIGIHGEDIETSRVTKIQVPREKYEANQVKKVSFVKDISVK